MVTTVWWNAIIMHMLDHADIDRLRCHRLMHKYLTATEQEVLLMQLSIIMFKASSLFDDWLISACRIGISC